MSVRTILRSAAFVAAGALLSTTAAAQAGLTNCVNWDRTNYDPAGNLVVEGFLVAQEGFAGVEVFSSSARKWTTIAPPGSGIVGKGDWCLLVREPTGMTAYSARLNNSATLPFMGGALPLFFDCHDDVCFVVGVDNTGVLVAWAYSAVHGVWVPQPLVGGVTPADYVISRFTVGLRDQNQYHGFSARLGAWATFNGPFANAPMKADGNTLMVDFTAAPAPRLAAFSGVRGCWTASPLLVAGTPILLDHNVLYARGVSGMAGMFNPCAYSAYSAAWNLSATPRSPFTNEQISDNVVITNDASTVFGIEAYGAGHATWNILPGNFAFLNLDEDYAMAYQLGTLDLAGFSGLCGGPWVPENNPTNAFPAPVVPPDHIGAADTGNSFHTFLPGRNQWAPVLPKSPLDAVLVADAVLEVTGTGVTWGITTRWGNWVASPALSPITAGTGSVIVHQSFGGIIDSLDERCGQYNVPYALSGPSLMSPGRNLCVFQSNISTSNSLIEAYSVQRGDYTSPGFLPMPLVVGPIPEENVAALVDNGGNLWAYGSANDGHTYYQWPNCTEYHVSKAAGQNPNCKPVLFGYGTRSNPGNISFLLLGTGIQCPPIVLPGYCGELWLPLAGIQLYATLGLHDPDCMLEYKALIPFGLPQCIQAWLQPITFDVNAGVFCFGCKRADAAWIF